MAAMFKRPRDAIANAGAAVVTLRDAVYPHA
jgi:hypothetical protein